MVLAVTLPAVTRRIEPEHGRRLVDEGHGRDRIDLRPVQRKHVRRPPVQVPAIVVVDEQIGRPRPRRQVGVGAGGRVTAGHRTRDARHSPGIEVPPPGLWPVAGQHSQGIERRLHQIQPLSVRHGSRSDRSVQRPAIGFDEAPFGQVARHPVSVGLGHEQIIAVLMQDHGRLGPGAIADALVGLFEIIFVIDVDRVGPGPPDRLGGGRPSGQHRHQGGRGGGKQQGGQDREQYAHVAMLSRLWPLAMGGRA